MYFGAIKNKTLSEPSQEHLSNPHVHACEKKNTPTSALQIMPLLTNVKTKKNN